MNNTSDARSLSSDAQAALRRRAVEAVRRGMKKAHAAQAFGVTWFSVHKWVEAAKTGGLPALRSTKRGRPPESRLKPHETATTVRLITSKCPDQMMLPFALWTREAVQCLLKKRLGIEVSVWTVGRYLREWGLTPQKPLRRAYERDAKAVKRWLEEEYPAIRALARSLRAEIHWGDEMGVRSDHQAGRSYGIRGRTPVITGTGQRFGCNMISTITNKGVLAFMVFTGRFTARVFLKFLRRLLKQRPRKIFVIVDGHPVHRAGTVQRWVNQNREQIRLFSLPPYSPDLNPDELLNQDVKTNAVGRQRPSDRAELLGNVRCYLRSTQRMPHVVRNYFHEKSVAYAAG
jgi:transposase